MLKYLLGVDVTSPGAATVSVAPPDKGLSRTAGSQWTQRGPVDVNWSRAQDGHVVLEIGVPVNVQATVSLPDADAAIYVASGQGDAQFVGLQNGRAIFTVGSGDTNFHVRGQS
jgi:Bacterial alpha-L-rhamnosidase C-terminal domain